MTDGKSAEVRRILDRYLLEVVEAYDLCPWATSARSSGEVALEILWGTPTIEAWIAASRAALAAPGMRVAMVVAPELAIDPIGLRRVRDVLVLEFPAAGVAQFHPEAPLDLASPARLVPFVRRSPDPLMQLVPLSLLATVRSGTTPVIDLADQALILGGCIVTNREDVGDRIARANHTTVAAQHAEIEALLGAIAEDRRTGYARAGINGCR